MAHAEQYQKTIIDIQCQAFNHMGTVDSVQMLFKVWFERSKQRRRLSALTPDLLQDIGLTTDDVRTECRKFFWQP